MRPIPEPATVLRTCRRLEGSTPTTRLGNPDDPLDDLIYVVLTNRSGPAVAQRVFKELRGRYQTWDHLSGAPLDEVETLLRPLGLSHRRALYLRSTLAKICLRFGVVDLTALRDWNTVDAQTFLESLPGVSTKVAKCVLSFALNRAVLPVDVHVHRVASRLGWVDRRRADQSHEQVEAVVPARYRRSFHVAAINLGRTVCRPVPKCASCPIQEACAFGVVAARAGRPATP